MYLFSMQLLAVVANSQWAKSRGQIVNKVTKCSNCVTLNLTVTKL